VTTIGAACDTCPLSLACFSGHLDPHQVGLCFHCGSVVMFAAAGSRADFHGVMLVARRHEIDTYRCHNPLQFLDAVQHPVRYYKDGMLFGTPTLMPIEYDRPLLWPDIGEIAVTCVACQEAHDRETRRQRPRLILPWRPAPPPPPPKPVAQEDYAKLYLSAILALTPTGDK
jgi:hypothetical protein